MFMDLSTACFDIHGCVNGMINVRGSVNNML